MQTKTQAPPVTRAGTPAVERSGGFLRKLLVILIPLLIVVGFIIALQVIVAANEKPQVKQKSFNPLAVTADYAFQDDVQLIVKAQGEVRPRTEIDLVPEVAGKIVYVSPNFIDGGIIKKGETLIRIDDSDYKVAVIRADSSVAQAEQSLIQEVAEGEIARRDFEELGSGEPTALAMRQPQRARAEAGLQAAKAELQSARLQLARTAVKAPFSGRVKTKSSDLGQYVGPGARLGRIFSTDIVEVRLALTDSDLAKLNLPIAHVAKDRTSALAVNFSATIGGRQQNWQGRIMRTASNYDTQTRALNAIAEVFDPYGKGMSEGGMPLVPGLFVQAEIAGKTYENVIVIPRDGLRPENKVYVVDDQGNAEIKDAIVIDTSADRAVLESGVSAGELIILGPMEKSRVAMTLKVLDANDPNVVLVDPPKPEWMIELEAKEAQEKNNKKKKKRGRNKDDDNDNDNDKVEDENEEKSSSDTPAETSE